MQNSGLIDKWLQDVFFEAILKNPNKKKKRNRRSHGLSISHLKLSFMLFFGGTFLAFVVLCVENCVFEYKRRKGELFAAMRRASNISWRDHSSAIEVMDDTDGEVKTLYSEPGSTPTVSRLGSLKDFYGPEDNMLRIRNRGNFQDEE